MRRSPAASGTVSAMGRLSTDWVAMPERAVGERGSRPCRPAVGTASSTLESGTARGPALAEFMVMTGMVRLPRRAKCLVSCRVSRLVSQLSRVSDVRGLSGVWSRSWSRVIAAVWCLVPGHRSCLVSGPGSSQRWLMDRARRQRQSREQEGLAAFHIHGARGDDRALKASPNGRASPGLDRPPASPPSPPALPRAVWV